MSNQCAQFINDILERLHPWAKVHFEFVGRAHLVFIAGGRRYCLEFFPFQVYEVVDGVADRKTPAAIRTRQELEGWLRDDAGERCAPNSAPLPGNWETLCNFADSVSATTKKPLDNLGGFNSMETLPQDKRVLFRTDTGQCLVGWADSRDQRFRAITIHNGRPELTVGIRPNGWLPID